MITFVVIVGLIIALLGLVGCLVPVLPGPPLSFLALLVISFARSWEPFSTAFLLTAGGFMVVVTLLDYVLAVAGARKYGASRAGVWGSVVGMFAGIFFFPPWGMLLGAVAGALLGEIWSGKAGREALRAGWGVIMGNIAAVVVKLAYSGAVLFFYIAAMF